jgi:hypothetical protein
MHFLNWLFVVAALVFVACLSLVKMTCDLSQVGVHEAPESHESIPAELRTAR